MIGLLVGAKKKQRVQEVFLFTNYGEGFFWPEDTKEDGFKAEVNGKKKRLLMRKTDKKGSALKYKLPLPCNPCKFL